MKTMNVNAWMEYMDALERREYEEMLNAKYGRSDKDNESDKKEDEEKVSTKKGKA